MDNFQEQYIPPTLKLRSLISSLSFITGRASSELINFIGSVKKIIIQDLHNLNIVVLTLY